jgi:hypothetical protein
MIPMCMILGYWRFCYIYENITWTLASGLLHNYWIVQIGHSSF